MKDFSLPKCLLLLTSLNLSVFCLSAGAQSSTENEWTWISGSNLNGSNGYAAGTYGTLGVPSPENVPSGRNLVATWTDSHGHLWLFGGFLVQGTQLYTMNDMWEFDPAASQWTWQGGSSSPPCGIVQGNTQCFQAGVYGTKGKAAAMNFPGGRFSAASWTDKAGNLWLYGGLGSDEMGQYGELNDLWEFDTAAKVWTWVNGDSKLPGTGYGDPGVYGTIGVPAAANNPGALVFADVWADASGSAWLFGGWGFDVNGTNGLPNNVWKFDSALGQWAWMQGSSPFFPPWIHPSVYGTMGTFAAANVPGSRFLGSTWTDSKGNMWLFGGQGYDSQDNSGFLNELWQFDPSTNQWAWMAGQTVMACVPNSNKQNCGNAGVYGTLGQYASTNLPGGRTQAVSWTDTDGRLWLMGGAGFNGLGVYTTLNDMWEFNPSNDQWAWVGGRQNSGPEYGVYGTKGVPAAANLPGGRTNAATWTDASGNFWLFGGGAFDASGKVGELNDLWKFQPSNTINLPGPNFSLALSRASLLVNSGQTTSTTVNISPTGGFAAAVSFACTGLPAGVSCSFSPASVTPSGATASSTLTLTASASASLIPGRGPIFPAALAVIALCFIGRRPLSFLPLIALAAIGFILISGCGVTLRPQDHPPAHYVHLYRHRLIGFPATRGHCFTYAEPIQLKTTRAAGLRSDLTCCHSAPQIPIRCTRVGLTGPCD